MRVSTYNDVRFPGDWEVNFIGRHWQLRIGRSQVTLWHNLRVVVSWLSRRARPSAPGLIPDQLPPQMPES